MSYRATISRWWSRWFEQTPAIASSLLPSEGGDVLELDELWLFVGSKQQERWLWLALRRTRLAYCIDDRSENSALQLWRQLPDDYVHCVSFGDCWQPYAHVLSSSVIVWSISRRVKPIMLNVGSIPSANVWHVLHGEL